MPSTTLELQTNEDAPAQARRALARFREELPEDRYQAAGLLVSELVTNAVKYGGGKRVRLELSSRPDVFRAEVVDEGKGFTAPTRNPSDLARPGGWGLHLVDALADRWGAYEGSTHVWFELAKGSRGEA